MVISFAFTASAQPFSFNSLAPKSRNAVIPLLHINTNSAAYTLYNFTPTYNSAKIDNGKTDFQANQDFAKDIYPHLIYNGDLNGDSKPDLYTTIHQ